jgi:hypothetical protein
MIDGGACVSWRWPTTTSANACRWWPTHRFRASETPRELDKIVAVRGRRRGIVWDDATELTSTAILAWSDRHKIA